MERKVIPRKRLPANLPTMGTLVWYMFLDKINAPGWVWGVMGTLFTVFWIASIVAMFVQKEVDVIKD